MSGGVHLARKNLFHDRRRAALSIAGVGTALLLVLVLNGVVHGAMRDVTTYIRTSPADVFVSQDGVRTIHMSQSVLDPSVADDVAQLDGVAWTEPLRYSGSLLEAAAGRRFTYVFGYDASTGRGGPRRFVTGGPPRSGEAVVDETVADELDLAIGDEVLTLGTRFRVSGLSTGGTSIANTTVFVRTEDFARLRGPAVAYVLVGIARGTSAEAAVRRITNAVPGVTAQTAVDFARQEASLVRDMAADILTIMSAVGFLIALAVVALTLFTLTLAKLREYGVLKAIGAGPARLAVTVVGQTLWSVGLGLVVAIVLTFAVGVALDRLTPNLHVLVSSGSVVRTAAGALVVGALGALAPLRRVAKVDPATAFRRL